MRVYLHTFGCKANQYDTERIRQELEARGRVTVESADRADLCVVNTCTVTNQADAEARRYVRRIRRENPGLEVVVVGCSAILRPDEYRGLEGVVGVVEGHDPEEVARTAEESRPRAASPLVQLQSGFDDGDGAVCQDGTDGPSPDGWGILTERRGATRGWLKIQDGCDRKCSFCATRLVRGVSRSRPVAEVVEEARVLSRAHPELVLTGIHIGHYGGDMHPATSLSELAARLLDEVPGVRFRLGSVEATEIDDLLLDLLEKSGGWLAPHLHMPMQSGSDQVLARMRRWHTRDMYRARALEVAARVAVLGLGADVIAGFPGETSDDHQDTLSLIEELPFTYLHVFPFSPRTRTAAAEMPDQVTQRIAGERSRELRELGVEKGGAHRARRVGGWADVILEGDGGRGLTGDYLRVEVTTNGSAPEGTFRRARLQGGPDHLCIDLTRPSDTLDDHVTTVSP